MSAKARDIGATNLSERIEVVEPRDELGELAGTLNDLLARLDQSFSTQRRFMADASHELRSPVAILQGELDVTLSRDDRNAADYRDSLEVMRRSVRRLTRIVRDLFLLARSDAGDVPLKREPLYIGEVVAQTVRGYRTVAAERHVALVADCDTQLVVEGDDDLLQRMVGNVVENAIRHAPDETTVRIRCSAASGLARVEVEDSGAGVPEPLREKIFERFFRADESRPVTTLQAGSGAGLGLPIARWIASAHDGALWLERSDAGGSLFVITMPLHRHGGSSSI
jgi:signal transduction histidine kinase